MAGTPEGRVKDAVKKRLIGYGVLPFTQAAQLDPNDYCGFFWMPVQGQFAVQGVHDIVGVWHGIFFSIETKSPSNRKDATEAQMDFHRVVRSAGGISVVGARSAEAVDLVLTEIITLKGLV